MMYMVLHAGSEGHVKFDSSSATHTATTVYLHLPIYALKSCAHNLRIVYAKIYIKHQIEHLCSSSYIAHNKDK